MKNNKGNIKINLIAVIAIVLIIFLAVLIFFKFKGNGNKNQNSSTGTGEYTDTMSYIEDDGKNYIFIDSNANVRKISKSSIGTIDNVNEGQIFYHNGLLVKKDDKESIINFNGKTVYGPGKISKLVSTNEATLYQYEDNGKYGVLNANGDVIVEAKYSSRFNAFEEKLGCYFYVIDRESSGNVLNVFDKDGKVVYTSPVESSSLYGSMCGRTRTGVSLLAVIILLILK